MSLSQIGFQEGQHFYTVDKLIEAQKAIDKINEARRAESRRIYIRGMCRVAAVQWIRPVRAAYYIRGPAA